MRAAVFHGRGDVRIEEVRDPGPAAPDEIVLEVILAGICGTDAAEWAHGPVLTALEDEHPTSGHRGPVVLGHEFVGRVVDRGSEVVGFALGDRVACGAGVSCGSCMWCRAERTNLCAEYYTIGLHRHGGLAARVSAPARICRSVPDAVSDQAAALAQPLAVGLHAVRRAGLRRGDTVVVIGIGGIGAFVVAAAADAGVGRVVAIDKVAERLETARQLGADELVNVAATDTVASIRDLTGGVGADVVIEASGAPDAPAAAVAATCRGGRVLLVGLQSAPRQLDLLSTTVREVDILSTVAHVCDSDLPQAIDLLARRQLVDVVLERVIPLARLVEDGLRPLAEGTARGKIPVDPVA